MSEKTLHFLRLAAETLKNFSKSLKPTLDPIFDPEIYDPEFKPWVNLSIEEAADYLGIKLGDSAESIRTQLYHILSAHNRTYDAFQGDRDIRKAMEMIKYYGRMLLAAA